MPTQAPLAQGNEVFHDAYGSARSRAQSTAPVLVLLGDNLVAFRAGERHDFPDPATHYHEAKSVAHIAVALYAIVRESEVAPIDVSDRARLVGLESSISRAIEDLETDPDPTSRKVLNPLLTILRSLADEALRDGSVSASSLHVYARAVGPMLLALTEHATRVALDSLHARVEKALVAFDDEEKKALQVVVAGDHQARARSLGMQYFRKRLDEPEGIEDRVTYGENVTTVEDALSLVGTRLLDRAIAHAFFGDEKRLQRDVLGDAAKALLATLDLDLIGS